MGTPRGLGTTIWILTSNPQITPSFTGKRAQILLSNGALMPFFGLQYKPPRTAKIDGVSATLRLIQKGQSSFKLTESTFGWDFSWRSLDNETTNLIRQTIDHLAASDSNFVAVHPLNHCQLVYSDFSQLFPRQLTSEFVYITLMGAKGATMSFDSANTVIDINASEFLDLLLAWCTNLTA
jgi:hypothetical protein